MQIQCICTQQSSTYRRSTVLLFDNFVQVISVRIVYWLLLWRQYINATRQQGHPYFYNQKGLDARGRGASVEIYVRRIKLDVYYLSSSGGEQSRRLSLPRVHSEFQIEPTLYAFNKIINKLIRVANQSPQSYKNFVHCN